MDQIDTYLMTGISSSACLTAYQTEGISGIRGTMICPMPEDSICEQDETTDHD